MYPGPGIPRLHGVEGALVETEIGLPALAGEVELSMLATLPLFDGTLDRERQLHRQAGHVRLDLVEVLLTKVLHRVAHRIRLEHGDSLQSVTDY